MAFCSGECSKYRSRKLPVSRLRYAYGDKWCCYCSVFMKCDSRKCPCCATRLRTRPVRRMMLLKNVAA